MRFKNRSDRKYFNRSMVNANIFIRGKCSIAVIDFVGKQSKKNYKVQCNVLLAELWCCVETNSVTKFLCLLQCI